MCEMLPEPEMSCDAWSFKVRVALWREGCSSWFQSGSPTLFIRTVLSSGQALGGGAGQGALACYNT